MYFVVEMLMYPFLFHHHHHHHTHTHTKKTNVTSLTSQPPSPPKTSNTSCISLASLRISFGYHVVWLMLIFQYEAYPTRRRLTGMIEFGLSIAQALHKYKVCLMDS